MMQKQTTSLSKWIIGSVATTLALSLVACGGDSGSNPDPSAPALSSSSSYVPPVTDPNAPVSISDLEASQEGRFVYLDGDVSVVDAQDTAVRVIDSIVFGVSPVGPTVSLSKSFVPMGTVSLYSDLGARIDLDGTENCGTFTVYVTAYALGKPTVASVQYTKPADLCQVAPSSSSVAERPLSSATFTLFAQKGIGVHAIDLDEMKTYTDIAEIAENDQVIDLILGVESSQAFLYTPNAVGDVSEYSSIDAAGAYKGSLYVSELASSAIVESSTQLTFNERDREDAATLSRGFYYVVKTDQYDAATQKGLFLVKAPEQGLPLATPSSQLNFTVWSVSP
jgi:hypothetical protein